MTRPDWWFKADVGFASNPKILTLTSQIGPIGWFVYSCILAENRRKDGDGTIEASETFRTHTSTVAHISTEQLDDVFTHLERVDLIAINGGTLSIPGHDEQWKPQRKSTDRVRSHRNKVKRSTDTPRNVSKRSTGAGRNVTKQTEKSRQDKKRVEKKREEKTSKVAALTASTVALFNKAFDRTLQDAPWEASVQRVLSKGYGEPEIRAVIWWAAESWPEHIQKSISPRTLLKFQSTDGRGTFPEYLNSAHDLWVQQEGEKPPPWAKIAGEGAA